MKRKIDFKTCWCDSGDEQERCCSGAVFSELERGFAEMILHSIYCEYDNNDDEKINEENCKIYHIMQLSNFNRDWCEMFDDEEEGFYEGYGSVTIFEEFIEWVKEFYDAHYNK